MKLTDGFDSNYRFIQVAAKRARQLPNGARPQVTPHSAGLNPPFSHLWSPSPRRDTVRPPP